MNNMEIDEYIKQQLKYYQDYIIPRMLNVDHTPAIEFIKTLLYQEKEKWVKDEQYRIWGEVFLLTESKLDAKSIDNIRKAIFHINIK